MSIFLSGVESYRETTKWLSAFLPLTAVAATGAVLRPTALARLTIEPFSLPWWATNWPIVVSLVLTIAGIAVVLWQGSKVLSVEPPITITALNQEAPKLEALIGRGALEPYFTDQQSYDDALQRQQAADDNPPEEESNQENPVADSRVRRLEAAHHQLREWLLLDAVGTAYGRFRVGFVAACAAVLCSLLVVAGTADTAKVFTSPTAVAVEVSDAAAPTLIAATGCTGVTTTTFTALRGTWAHPVLAADGAGCRFGAVWVPDPAQIEIRVKRAGS